MNENLNMVWYIVPIVANNTLYNTIYYNETSSDFVDSVIVPLSNENLFVQNCIDDQEDNVIGLVSFNLINEQNNSIINIDGESNGIYVMILF